MCFFILCFYNILAEVFLLMDIHYLLSGLRQCLTDPELVGLHTNDAFTTPPFVSLNQYAF